MGDHNLGAENSHTRYIDKLEAKLAQLRADNAVLAKKHGLLADEVEAWLEVNRAVTDHAAKQIPGSYKVVVAAAKQMLRAARAATDASGALERGGEKP